MDKAFLELMPSVVLVQRYQGDDDFGNNLFAPAESIRCRIDNDQRNMGGGASRSGVVAQAVTLNTLIYTDYTEPPFTIRDRLTMPDNAHPTITSVTVHYDEVGPYHQVITAEDSRE